MNKKFEDIEIGEIFFEWGERDNTWIKHLKVSESKAIRKHPQVIREGKDVEFEFHPDAICTIFNDIT